MVCYGWGEVNDSETWSSLFFKKCTAVDGSIIILSLVFMFLHPYGTVPVHGIWQHGSRKWEILTCYNLWVKSSNQPTGQPVNFQWVEGTSLQTLALVGTLVQFCVSRSVDWHFRCVLPLSSKGKSNCLYTSWLNGIPIILTGWPVEGICTKEWSCFDILSTISSCCCIAPCNALWIK
jgi:hypothetical protein